VPEEAALFSPCWLLPENEDAARVLQVSRQVFGRTTAQSLPTMSARVPFGARCALATRPALGLTSCFAPSPSWERSTDHGELHRVVLRPADGRLVVEQDDRRLVAKAREAMLIDLGRPARLIMPDLGRLDIVEIDESRLPAPVTEGTCLRVIPRANRSLQVLAHYGALVLRGLFPLHTEVLRDLALDHIHALVAAMLADPGAPPAQSEDRRAARLAALKADIEARLDRHDLGIETIAALHGVTVRTIQKLFETEGTTFSDYVLDRRLERVWASLVACDPSSPSISALAFGNGFGDLSYFNRRFRRRYGKSPSQVRRSASDIAV
jgi:AraC-like DNA-binding protein